MKLSNISNKGNKFGVDAIFKVSDTQNLEELKEKLDVLKKTGVDSDFSEEEYSAETFSVSGLSGEKSRQEKVAQFSKHKDFMESEFRRIKRSLTKEMSFDFSDCGELSIKKALELLDSACDQDKEEEVLARNAKRYFEKAVHELTDKALLLIKERKLVTLNLTDATVSVNIDPRDDFSFTYSVRTINDKNSKSTDLYQDWYESLEREINNWLGLYTEKLKSIKDDFKVVLKTNLGDSYDYKNVLTVPQFFRAHTNIRKFWDSNFVDSDDLKKSFLSVQKPFQFYQSRVAPDLLKQKKSISEKMDQVVEKYPIKKDSLAKLSNVPISKFLSSEPEAILDCALIETKEDQVIYLTPKSLKRLSPEILQKIVKAGEIKMAKELGAGNFYPERHCFIKELEKPEMRNGIKMTHEVIAFKNSMTTGFEVSSITKSFAYSTTSEVKEVPFLFEIKIPEIHGICVVNLEYSMESLFVQKIKPSK